MSETDKPVVSVVMPVYNGERFLAEAIESILTQTFTDFELLVVDDGSSDGSAAIARDYAKGDERIRLIKHDFNRGAASARNSGIFAARGKFIAAMDCDDISLPQRLEKQVAYLGSHPDIGVVGGFLEFAFDDMTGFQLLEFPQLHALIVLNWIHGLRSVAGAVYMARRQILMSVGGYKENRKFAADEDHELISRLLWKTRFANLPELLYHYRRHDHQNSVRLREEQLLASRSTRQLWLNRLWGEGPRPSMERLERLRLGAKVSWRERWRLRGDIGRLIDAMIAANILVDSDLPVIEAEMNGRLESTMPRRWQMLLYWRRRRFGPG